MRPSRGDREVTEDVARHRQRQDQQPAERLATRETGRRDTSHASPTPRTVLQTATPTSSSAVDPISPGSRVRHCWLHMSVCGRNTLDTNMTTGTAMAIAVRIEVVDQPHRSRRARGRDSFGDSGTGRSVDTTCQPYPTSSMMRTAAGFRAPRSAAFNWSRRKSVPNSSVIKRLGRHGRVRRVLVVRVDEDALAVGGEPLDELLGEFGVVGPLGDTAA